MSLVAYARGEHAMRISSWLWVSILALGLVVLLWMSSQGAVSLKPLIAARFPEVRWVDSRTLSEWVEREPVGQPVILDTRTEAEFAVSHLRGARRVDPDEPKIASLRIDPDATVVVYCSVGYRSAVIAEQLHRAGIGEVYNLEGGIFTWANEDRPIYRNDERVKQAHPYNWAWGHLLRRELRAPR